MQSATCVLLSRGKFDSESKNPRAPGSRENPFWRWKIKSGLVLELQLSDAELVQCAIEGTNALGRLYSTPNIRKSKADALKALFAPFRNRKAPRRSDEKREEVGKQLEEALDSHTEQWLHASGVEQQFEKLLLGLCSEGDGAVALKRITQAWAAWLRPMMEDDVCDTVRKTLLEFYTAQVDALFLASRRGERTDPIPTIRESLGKAIGAPDAIWTDDWERLKPQVQEALLKSLKAIERRQVESLLCLTLRGWAATSLRCVADAFGVL